MNEIHAGGTMTQGAQTLIARANVRMNLAYQHLLAAASFARSAQALEAQNLDQPFGEFFSDIIGYVSGSVIMSVAALEAYINEVFVDYQIYFPDRDAVIFELLWEAIKKSDKTLDKYQTALKLNRVSLFEIGKNPYQDAKLLIGLRNELVHFKPEWDDDANEHIKLATKLESKIDFSPFVEG